MLRWLGFGPNDAANIIPDTPPAEIRILSTIVNPQGDVVITWSAEAGVIYRVQYKDALDAAWNNLENVTAAGSTASALDPLSTAPAQRFYRVQLNP